MAAYVIYQQLEVLDQALIDEYRATVRPVMDKYGARVLAAVPEAQVLEGEWGGVRTMIIEFPDREAVQRWHASDDYKPFLEMRLRATRGNLVVVEGV